MWLGVSFSLQPLEYLNPNLREICPTHRPVAAIFYFDQGSLLPEAFSDAALNSYGCNSIGGSTHYQNRALDALSVHVCGRPAPQQRANANLKSGHTRFI